MDGRDKPDHDNPGSKQESHTARARTPRSADGDAKDAAERGAATYARTDGAQSGCLRLGGVIGSWLRRVCGGRAARPTQAPGQAGRPWEDHERPEAGGGNQHEHRAALRHRSRRVLARSLPDVRAPALNRPIAFVPQLGSTLFTRRDDIFVSEKNIDVFSSHQPSGLMNKLMGHNMMRKDGDAHMSERKAIFPSVSPKTVKAHWSAQFQAHADRLLDELAPAGRADLVKAFALPLSAECLKSHHRPHQHALSGHGCLVAGHDRRHRQLRRRSGRGSALPRGDGRYRRGHRRHGSRACKKSPNPSLLSVMLEGGMPMESVRANIKLAISGGQNEPRDAIAGCIWALLTHPEQLETGPRRESALAAGVRGIRALDLADRHVAAPDRQALVDTTASSSSRTTASSSCSARPIATRRTFRDADRFDACRATPPRASPSALARISAPAPGPRAPWWPMSRCRAHSRGSAG